MQMTEEEIVRRYKQADNKRDSIRILAELNGCQKQTIRDILEANGLGVPKVGNRYTAQAKALKEKMAEAGEAVASAAQEAMQTMTDAAAAAFAPPENLKSEIENLKSEIENENAATPTTCVAPEPVTVWPEAPNEVLNAAIERLIEIEGQLEELQRKKMALDTQIGALENTADRFRAWIEATREAKRKEE